MILSIISIICYYHFNYYDDHIIPKTKSFIWLWSNTGSFKLEMGYFLIPMMLSIIILIEGLEPNTNIFKEIKPYCIWKFKQGKQELKEYLNR